MSDYCDECKEEIASNSYCSCVGLSQEKLTQVNIKEIQALKEQLARMGEEVSHAVKYLKSTNPHSACNPEEGFHEPECVMLRCLENALSSYDPKWVEGVREKAQKEIVDYLTLKFAENGPVGIAHDIRKLWENLKAVRQPNQSREKRG